MFEITLHHLFTLHFYIINYLKMYIKCNSDLVWKYLKFKWVFFFTSHRDRKKKKYVGEKGGKETVKKFKTESGTYIPVSYKKDLYPSNMLLL